MREQSGGRVAYQANFFDIVFANGWLRAGLGSFAYRLAHLRVSRRLIVGALSAAFILV